MAGPDGTCGRNASCARGGHHRASPTRSHQGLSALDDTTPEPSPPPLEPREGVPEVITDLASLGAYCARLAGGSGPVAIDAERASGFRYSQRAYLIQIRRAGAGTALIDPIALPDLAALQQAIGGAEWILHAATQDLPCLADVGLRPDALFDTELAGRLLGRERVGLAALMLSELGQVIEKGHGATDWSARPLTAAQLRYAALDVELLIELRDVLAEELRSAGKWEIAQEEFHSLLAFEPRPRTDEDWRRTSGLHRVRKPRALAVVRELWRARDELARERDIAVGRLLPDTALIAAAESDAGSVEALLETDGFHGRGAQRYARRWWAAVSAARQLPEAELPLRTPRAEGPPPPRAWADRDPQAHARLSRARADLAAAAESLHLPVENLLSPETVRRLCWNPPVPAGLTDVQDFLRLHGARPWQIESCADLLMRALDEPAQPAVPLDDPDPSDSEVTHE